MDIILTQSIRTLQSLYSYAHSVAYIVTHTPYPPLHHGTIRLSYPYLYTYPTVHLRNMPTLPIRHSFITHTPLMTPYVRLIPYPYYAIYITCRISFTFVHSLR